MNKKNLNMNNNNNNINIINNDKIKHIHILNSNGNSIANGNCSIWKQLRIWKKKSLVELYEKNCVRKKLYMNIWLQ